MGLLPYLVDERRVVELERLGGELLPFRLSPLVAEELLRPAVVDAVEVRARADRPGRGGAGDPEDLLDLVHQVERVAAGPVQLVHERRDRDLPHPADLEELDRLRLDPLGGVDEHDGAVGGGEGAVSVFAEVVVLRRVEEVHVPAGVRELHDARRDRDAALALHLHPVARGVPARLARLHRAGEVDRPSVEEELLRQRRLAGVGVADDREGPAAGDLGREGVVQVRHGAVRREGRRAGRRGGGL